MWADTPPSTPSGLVLITALPTVTITATIPSTTGAATITVP